MQVFTERLCRKPLYTTRKGEHIEFWRPIKPSSYQVPELLEINQNIRMGTFPFEEDYDFWQSFGLA